jgi:hypothetical protein
MASNALSASRPGAGSVVLTATANISAQIVGVGVVAQQGASADGGGVAGAIQAYGSRRRFMRMVEYDPRLARKLGIRGKLQALD